MQLRDGDHCDAAVRMGAMVRRPDHVIEIHFDNQNSIIHLPVHHDAPEYERSNGGAPWHTSTTSGRVVESSLAHNSSKPHHLQPLPCFRSLVQALRR